MTSLDLTTKWSRSTSALVVIAAAVLGAVILTSAPASAAAPSPGVLAIIAGRENVCAAATPGPATSSALCGTAAVATDSAGDVYIADANNEVVEKVTPSGTLSIFAGGGSTAPLTCTVSSPCAATHVALFNPDGVAVDAGGDVYIADFANNLIEKVTAAGSLSVFAGNGTSGVPTPGPATSSDLAAPNGVNVDAAGNVYLSETDQFVLKVTASGTLSILAGTGTGGTPTPGPATSSKLDVPNAVAVDGAGNAYIADVVNNVIEKVTPSGTLSIFAGTGTGGAPTPGPATASRLNDPQGVAFDAAGNLYIADTSNQVVEKVTPSGALSVVAGTGTQGLSSAGPATASDLHFPSSVAIDGAGNLYIADTGNNVVAEVGGTASPPAAGPLVASAPGGAGYWTVTASGAVTAHGTATTFGSLAAGVSAAPIVGLAATPDGGGYWLAAADGGVFSFGDAVFHGSEFGTALTKPVVAITSTPDGGGYWLAAADGGVFSLGNATFEGSEGGAKLAKPVVDMTRTADGHGYWLVGADGGVFTLGNAVFHGSVAGAPLVKPVIGITATATGGGYWLVAADGGVFALGDAPFAGSAAASGETAIGLVPTAGGTGYSVVDASGSPLTL
jgi:sugar lactone lactonase YvrE